LFDIIEQLEISNIEIIPYPDKLNSKLRLAQKFASGTSERLALPNSLSYSHRSDISTVGKITPQLFQKLVWLDRSDAPKAALLGTVFACDFKRDLKNPRAGLS
jgi:hypothetical protein